MIKLSEEDISRDSVSRKFLKFLNNHIIEYIQKFFLKKHLQFIEYYDRSKAVTRSTKTVTNSA